MNTVFELYKHGSNGIEPGHCLLRVNSNVFVKFNVLWARSELGYRGHRGHQAYRH